MAAFYLDEDVSEDLVPLLAQRGHFVATTTGERRKGIPDPRQLLYAVTSGWTLVTYNRGDYELLHDAWLMWAHEWGVRRMHHGILSVQPVPKGEVERIASAIHNLVHEPDVRLANSLYNWGQISGWRRWPR